MQLWIGPIGIAPHLTIFEEKKSIQTHMKNLMQIKY